MSEAEGPLAQAAGVTDKDVEKAWQERQMEAKPVIGHGRGAPGKGGGRRNDYATVTNTLARLAALEAERDRLREALRGIRAGIHFQYNNIHAPEICQTCMARAALGEDTE